MKRIKLVLLIACLAIFLSACSNDGSDKPDFKSIDYIPPHVETAAYEKLNTNNNPLDELENVETRGNLDPEGKLSYALSKDGILVLYGSDISIVIKDNDQLKNKVSEIKEIRFGSGVREIGENAFKDLTALERLAYTDNIESIGKYAFSGCAALSKGSFDGVKTIGEYAFDGCAKLQYVSLPEVETVGKYAFNKCVVLANVDFGPWFTTMGDNVFSECGSLKSVSFMSSVPEKALKGASSVESVSVVGENAVNIGEYAFSECVNLSSVNISENVEHIGERAFEGCSKLHDIALPDKVTVIQQSTFSDCTELKRIKLPKGIQTIEQDAFSGCGNLQSIELPSAIRKIDARAFENCTKLTSINSSDRSESSDRMNQWPNLEIGSYAFSGCSNLKELNLVVDLVGNYAFCKCGSLENLTLSAKAIGNNAFQGCSGLKVAEISVTGEIGMQAFQGCASLYNVKIDSKEIGSQAFSECGALTEISINAEKIGNQALERCTGLEKVTFSNPKADLGSKILQDCKLDHLVIAAERIPDNCFASVSVKKITMEKTVREIGKSAFEGCVMLTEIEVPSSVTKIGNYAFKDCSQLEKIVNEEKINSIPENIEMGMEIFKGCDRIKSLDIHAKEIGEGSLSGMQGLETINVSSTVKTIKKSAFADCTKLKYVDLKEANEGASVEIIEDEAFRGCTSLYKFRLPATLKNLGKYIFKDCNENMVLVFGGTKSEWTKVVGSKDYQYWTGLEQKRDMSNWCKDGYNYGKWEDN